MESSLREYHPGVTSRRRPGTGSNNISFNDKRKSPLSFAPRSSTPSLAVRKAMQVLDETYRQQSHLKNERWPQSMDRLHETDLASIKSRHSPNTSRSRSQSPVRSIGSPLGWTPPGLIEMERENYQEALGESETRREVLLQKLSDAQKTMEMQNSRIRASEGDNEENKATIRLLQQVQQELETKLEFLENERRNLMGKSRQDAEDRETTKRRIEELSRESNKLRCQLDLLLIDKQQHNTTLEHLQKTIDDLRKQNESTTELQAVTSSELRTVQDRLESCMRSLDASEDDKERAACELEKSRKSQQALINRNTDLGQRLSKCESELQHLTQDYDRCASDFGCCKEELHLSRDKLNKQHKDLSELRKSHHDMQHDRERTHKYNCELEKTVHSIKEINQDLKRQKIVSEDTITDLHADLAKARFELSKLSEEHASTSKTLDIKEKELEKASQHNTEFRSRIDELSVRLTDAESRHKNDMEQISATERLNGQLSREKEDLTTELKGLQESYQQLQNHCSDESTQLNQKVTELRCERDRAAAQVRETEAQLNRISDEMEASMRHSQSKLDHWRQACSKLTSLVEEKENEVHDLARQRRDAEDKLSLAETERRTMELQLNEAQVSHELLTQLKTENKKLAQESAENRQMIAVLEMQRDILSNAPVKASAQEELLKAQVEKFQAELALAKATAPSTFATSCERNDDVERLKEMNKMLAQQISSQRQEAETLQKILEDCKRNHERDFTKLRREKQQLEFQMTSFNSQMEANKNSHSRKVQENMSELRNLRSDVLRLRQDVEEKNQKVMAMQGECVILQNGKKRAEDRIASLETALSDEKRATVACRVRSNTSSPVREDAIHLNSELRIKSSKLEAAEAEVAALRAQLSDWKIARLSHDVVTNPLNGQINEHYAESQNDDDENAESLDEEIIALRQQLQHTMTEVTSQEKELSEWKKKYVDMKKMEQQVRQERDELKGRTIIMESLNESSQDMMKELHTLRDEKDHLEKQLSTFMSSKTSQTPPSTLSLVDDLDKEMEKQYKTVCERNSWLETRIASLQREIELVRDQNSLLQDQRNNAEREAAKIRDDFKDLQMTSKETRRRHDNEQAQLKRTNAEKIEQIMNLQRQVSEQKQMIKAMSNEIENIHKKSDKNKISSFMKKLRRGSDPPPTITGNGEWNPSFILPNTTTDSSSSVGAGNIDTDIGYSTANTTLPPTLPLPASKSRSSSLSPTRNTSNNKRLSPERTSPIKVSSETYDLRPRPSAHSPTPVSPSLTNVTDPMSARKSSHRGSRRRSSSPRVSFEDDEDFEEEEESSPENSPTSGGGDAAVEGGAGEVFLSDHYAVEDQLRQLNRFQPVSARSQLDPFDEPQPEEAAKLPSPASSPSLPSPMMSARRRGAKPYCDIDEADVTDDSTEEHDSEADTDGSVALGTEQAAQSAEDGKEQVVRGRPPLQNQRPRSQPSNGSSSRHLAERKHSSLF